MTETHILLKCDLITASRQVILISIRNILLEEQLSAPSQLNALSQVLWNHILLFGHEKLKRSLSLQLYDALCKFFSVALA